VSLLITAGLAACGGSAGGSASSGPKTALHITVVTYPGAEVYSRPGQRPVVHNYILYCDPAKGTMPQPAAACEALSDLQHRSNAPGSCPPIGFSPPSSHVTISGQVYGSPYHLSLSAAESWCAQPRLVTRDYWALSTFTCKTAVSWTPFDGSPTTESKVASLVRLQTVLIHAGRCRAAIHRYRARTTPARPSVGPSCRLDSQFRVFRGGTDPQFWSGRAVRTTRGRRGTTRALCAPNAS
jgi:hypothetical protein